jgi:hypothetical protein
MIRNTNLLCYDKIIVRIAVQLPGFLLLINLYIPAQAFFQ